MVISDKLQALVNGKQLVINKVNEKASTTLKINCTWNELVAAIENIKGSSSGVLKDIVYGKDNEGIKHQIYALDEDGNKVPVSFVDLNKVTATDEEGNDLEVVCEDENGNRSYVIFEEV